jgi:RNA polymerase sigma factor (sigma-70 family)
MTVRPLSLQKSRMRSQSTVASTALQPSPMIEDDDLTLIRRVAAKDRQAFETLYYRYAPRLYRYLSKVIRQRELVEEVLNDAMLVVWQNASRFNHASRLSTWIFGIAHNKALKALARSANKSSDVPLATPEEWIDREGPEEALTRQEFGSTVARALEALSPEQRAVVELTFYHECSYQEIAEITGCPINTVKTRMFHARRRLAQILAGLGLRRPLGRQEEPG